MGIVGQCMCGETAYTVDEEVVQVLNCHCTLCRRMNGSAFSTYVVVRAPSMRFARGEASLAHYAVTARTARHFCRHCGTALFNSNPTTYPGLAMLYLGTLDNAAALRPALNIYSSSKLDWTDDMEGMKRFEEGPRARK